MSPRRLALVAVVLVAALGLCAWRAATLTIVRHDELLAQANRQQHRLIEKPAKRGDLISSDGFLLATSIERLAIEVDTEHLPYPELFAEVSGPLLGLDPVELASALADSRSRWRVIASEVDPEVAEQVRRKAPLAIVLLPDAARRYPLAPMAQPLIGFTRRRDGRVVGAEGLEYHFDGDLAGEPDQMIALRDAVQRALRLERRHSGRAGSDLELSIDAQLQARVESALDDIRSEIGARSASAVVLDLASSELMALATVPVYDPFDTPSDPDALRLRAVQSAFEPGSTVKPLVAAIALAADVVAPGELFDCNGRGLRVAGHWIRDHAPPGDYDIDQIITLSSNTGMALIAERIDAATLAGGFSAFGFGRRTGVGFPAEAHGILPDANQFSSMSKASLSLGQELIASPLQLASAYATIGNGGWWRPPVLIRNLASTRRGARSQLPAARRILDPALADRLQTMLEGVVTQGTGSGAALPGYRLGGKTGTAQRLGVDEAGHHVSWFAGLAPMGNPRVVIVVAVENPEATYWASSVAAPAFREVAQATLERLGIAPTEAKTTAGDLT